MKKITSRVRVVDEQSAYPGTPDETTKKELKELFEYVGSHYPEPEGLVITGGHAGIAIAAHNPPLALELLKTTHCVNKSTWAAEHYDLKELAVQVVNLYFKCDLCFQAHLVVAKRHQITIEQQAALPYWRTAAHIFSDDQRLVIEYTNAVCAGDVPDDLFSRVVKRFGERATVEFTAVVSIWACWAMILNATKTQFDFGYGAAAEAKTRTG